MQYFISLPPHLCISFPMSVCASVRVCVCAYIVFGQWLMFGHFPSTLLLLFHFHSNSSSSYSIWLIDTAIDNLPCPYRGPPSFPSNEYHFLLLNFFPFLLFMKGSNEIRNNKNLLLLLSSSSTGCSRANNQHSLLVIIQSKRPSIVIEMRLICCVKVQHKHSARLLTTDLLIALRSSRPVGDTFH